MSRNAELFGLDKLTGRMKDCTFNIFLEGKKAALLKIRVPRNLKRIAAFNDGVVHDKKNISLNNERFHSFGSQNNYHRWCPPELNICRYEVANQGKENFSESPAVAYVEINILRADGFGNQHSVANSARIARLRLFHRFNSTANRCHIFSGIDSADAKFIRSSQQPDVGLVFRKGNSNDCLSCSSYRAITDNFVLEVFCSRTRFDEKNSLDAYMAQLEHFADYIFARTRLTLIDQDLVGGESGAAVDESFRIEPVVQRSRFDIESDLFSNNIIGRDDCSFVLRENKDGKLEMLDDLAAAAEAGTLTQEEQTTAFSSYDTHHLEMRLDAKNKSSINFLSDELVIPSLDFANFQGVIKVPQAKNPDSAIEQEIQREIQRCYQQIKAMAE